MTHGSAVGGDDGSRLPGMLSGWSLLRAVHLVVGVGAFYAFGRSGEFMDQQLDHLRGMADAPRALYRSGHIYLLFIALLHLVLGFYLRSARSFVARVLQYVASAFLFGAVWLFAVGFYAETPLGLVERPGTRQAIYMTLNGVLLHGVAALFLGWLPETLRDTLAWPFSGRRRAAERGEP